VTDEKFSIEIHWSTDDDCWIASHPDLPGCVADGSTPVQALKQLVFAREVWEDSRKDGK